MRVICHIDLDAFYVQVERTLQRVPLGATEPCAVVQYNEFAGGGIIALSYEAKWAGVKRSMRGDDARKLCPGLRLVTVPVANEKADLTIYRDAGTQVFELLDKQGAVCERTSIDEAYIDITRLAVELAASGYTRKSAAGDADAVDGSATAGAAPSVDTVLAAGAVVAARLRDLVRVQTGYTMSAGVAENKLLAKHASGMHKPYQQTVVRPAAVNDLMRAVKITELNGLGGKKGEELKRTHGDLEFVADLQRFMDSVGNSKTFRGPDMLRTLPAVEKYIGLLSIELFDRLQVYKTRYGVRPSLATVALYRGTSRVTRKGTQVTIAGEQGLSASRSFQLSGELNSAADLAKRTLTAAKSYIIKEWKGSFEITALGIVTNKMVVIPKVTLLTFFGAASATSSDQAVSAVDGVDEVDPSTSDRRRDSGQQHDWKALTNPDAVDRAVLDAIDLPAEVRDELEASLTRSSKAQSKRQSTQPLFPPSTAGESACAAAAAATDPSELAAAAASGWICSKCTFRNDGEGASAWLQCTVCLAERCDGPASLAKTPPALKKAARRGSASSKRKSASETPLTSFFSKRAKDQQ